MRQKASFGRILINWEWLGLVILCLIVFAIMLPNRHPYESVKGKEAEVKQNLHAIQLAVERFAVDTEGVYPNYLIGGAPADPNGTPGTIAFTSDVLLREGYITSYPKNPFVRNPDVILEMQLKHPSSIAGNDPLRPGDPEGDLLGYRFGAEGNLMGQVLCDPRYEKWFVNDPLSGELVERNTWAIIEYPFWDTWEGNRPEPYMPGMFFYKGAGPVIIVGDAGEPEEQQGGNEHLSLDGDFVGPYHSIPTEIDQYMLGAYGSIRTKGKDVLGDEQQFEGNPVPSWTRSAYSATDLGGSPFRNIKGGESHEHMRYGNPNGIRDGIILVLTAGEDYIGDR